MTKEDQLFMPKQLHGNVVLNFTHTPKGEFPLQGDAYHRAAKVLVNHLLSQAGYSDLDAYPIVFMYRQSLELLIKAILLNGNRLAASRKKPELETPENRIFSTHGLSNSLPMLQKIFEAVGWIDAFEGSGLTNPDFIAVIKEFDYYDPGSYAFRYTVKRDGTPALPHHFVFSLSHFASVMDPILEALYGATIGLGENIAADMDEISLGDEAAEWFSDDEVNYGGEYEP